MATTIAQATEHVLVESATAVVTQVGNAAVGESSNIENSLAKEVVATTHGVPSNFVVKLEEGAQVVEKEAIKGAEAAVADVKAHPELIAEGALAVVIGAATLVQPELAAGEVAVIGKMAADRAKNTVTTIASTEGSKVVKAISKDLSDDATLKTAKVAATPNEKSVAEARQNPKALAGEVDVERLPTVDEQKLLQPASVVGNSKAAAIPAHNIPGCSTISIEIAPETSGTTQPVSINTKTGTSVAESVSLKVTIGADGEIKAVSKGSREELKNGATPSTEESTTASRAVPIDFAESIDIPKTAAVLPTSKLNQAPKDGMRPANMLPAEKSALTEDVCSPNGIPSAEPSANQKNATKGTKQDTSLLTKGANNGTSSKSAEGTSALSRSLATAGIVSSPITINTFAAGPAKAPLDPPLISISKESLDYLHWKIDNMQEAIKEMTRLLELHLPHNQATIAQPKNHETIVGGVASVTMAESLQLIHDNQAQLSDNTSAFESVLRKRPTIEKRSSILDMMGKVLWPFGSPKMANSDSAEEHTTDLLDPIMIKQPSVTTTEIVPEATEIII